VAAAGVGEGSVGLTMLTAVVTDAVGPVPHAVLAATAATQAAAGAELEGWVTAVDVVAAAVVVVVVVTTAETVFITEFTLADWLDITMLD